MPNEYGTHDFDIYIFSLDYPGDVAPIKIDLRVIMECTMNSFTVTSQPVDYLYTLNEGNYINDPLVLEQSENCLLPYTYTHQVYIDGSPTPSPLPAWINYDDVTGEFFLDESDPARVGEYRIVTTSAISTADLVPGSISEHVTEWTLTIRSDCELMTLIPRAYDPMLTYVDQAADTQNIYIDDDISLIHGDQNYCGNKIYTMSPDYPDFATITGDILTLASNDPAHVNIYPVEVTVAMEDYPMITPITIPIELEIRCEVLDI